MKALKLSNIGVTVGNCKICVLLYADDIVLLSETAVGLQKLLNIVWNYGKTWHFSFGTKKCQIILVTLLHTMD